MMRVSEEPVHVKLTVVGLDPTDKGGPVLDPMVNGVDSILPEKWRWT